MIITGKRILAIITGASRGIGRQIALALAGDVAGGSLFVLLARQTSLLEKVKAEILELNPTAKVTLVTFDLAGDASKLDLEPVLKDILGKETVESRLIFHNAGTVGNVTLPAADLSDASEWHSYLQLNVISAVILNNHVHQVLKNLGQLPLFVINVTSLAATKPFASFTQYCVGKAAREGYFRNFALETPHVKVLSYSPGPVDTDMVVEIGQNSYDSNVRAVFSNPAPTSTPEHRRRLTPQETVSKLIHILDLNEFPNGGRVDFFDS